MFHVVGRCSGAKAVLLWLNLLLPARDTRYQTSNAVLEIAILGSVDERVDTAVGEHQDHSEVVECCVTVEELWMKKRNWERNGE